MKEQMTQFIVDAIAQLQREGVWSDFDVPSIIVERPKDIAHGDWTSNSAFALARHVGKAPQEIAQEIAVTIQQQHNAEIADVQAVGGYVNMTIPRAVLTARLAEAVAQGDHYGAGTQLTGKQVLVEYTDPNPFKALHIGHVMSNAIGESIACLLEAQGATLIRANFYGDVGLHVAKALWGMGKIQTQSADDLGRAYALGAQAYETDEQAQTEIKELNKKIYARDESIAALYAHGKKTSLDHFEQMYAILGTQFDVYYPESEMAPVGQALVEKKIGTVFEKSDGAVVFDGEKKGLHTRVFINADGLPTYEAKDIGLLAQKFAHYPDAYLSLTITASEQKEYFKVVLAAAREIDASWASRTEHISHGMLQLADGKMSSRTGNIISGEDLIGQARAIAAQKMSERVAGDASQDTIDAIAVAGIKFGILKQHYEKNIIFDPDTALSFDGDSGPYIQYTYARCQSVVTKAQAQGYSFGGDQKLQPCEDSIVIERMIDQCHEIVARAADERAPHYIAQYALDLTHAFNAYYNDHKIIDQDNGAVSAYRVMLTHAVGQVLKNSLHLLGIKAPERM